MADDPYAVLRIRDFRLLLAGRLLGTVAMQIQGMAMGWQIYALTKSAMYLGLIGLSEALPAIGVALYAGHIADVLDRKVILKVVVSTMFASMMLLGLCSVGIGDSHVLVPIIFVINAISGIARGFYGPSDFRHGIRYSAKRIVSQRIGMEQRGLAGVSNDWTCSRWLAIRRTFGRKYIFRWCDFVVWDIRFAF